MRTDFLSRFSERRNIRALLLILLGLLFMGGPFPSFSEEQVQVVTMAVPINLAFPLLPSFAVIINNPVRAESEVIVMVGSDGIVGLIRVSVGN